MELIPDCKEEFRNIMDEEDASYKLIFPRFGGHIEKQ